MLYHFRFRARIGNKIEKTQKCMEVAEMNTERIQQHG
jgi:hypothetical protein